MKNYISPGDTLTVPSPGAVQSGQGLFVGDLFGVAAGDAENGAALDIATRGVFTLPKATGDVIAVGSRVFWEDGAVTVDSSDGEFIGFAAETRGAGANAIAVKIG